MVSWRENCGDVLSVNGSICYKPNCLNGAAVWTNTNKLETRGLNRTPLSSFYLLIIYLTDRRLSDVSSSCSLTCCERRVSQLCLLVSLIHRRLLTSCCFTERFKSLKCQNDDKRRRVTLWTHRHTSSSRTNDVQIINDKKRKSTSCDQTISLKTERFRFLLFYHQTF